MTLESLKSYNRKREEREKSEHRMLNSGFGAFEKWESKSSWRLNLRKILNEVKTNADLKSSECKLVSCGA